MTQGAAHLGHRTQRREAQGGRRSGETSALRSCRRMMLKAPSPSAEAPAAPVKRWRKRPPREKLKAAALAVAKTYQPNDPPTQPEWWEALKEYLPEVSRDVAIEAQREWAPHLLRKRGQKKRNRGSLNRRLFLLRRFSELVRNPSKRAPWRNSRRGALAMDTRNDMRVRTRQPSRRRSIARRKRRSPWISAVPARTTSTPAHGQQAPIGKLGKYLIASRNQLAAHARRRDRRLKL